jgi:peptide chain release factor subunit 1
MDRKEATIGVLEGKRIEVLQKMTSGIPSKVRAGGQSSQRFHRITEGLTKEFYKRIADEVKKIFFDNPKLKGLLVGGPIPTKDEFLDGKYLVTKLQEKVIGRVDIGGSDEAGLKELVKKSQQILADQEIIHEKKILEKFFKTLGEKPELATLKEENTKTALEYGAVDTLILSKTTDKKIAKKLKTLAENISSGIEIVSVDTEEGKQFENLGGIGAILRFKV